MTTEQDTARERITSYIVHQAKKEPDSIKKLVQKGHDQLLSQMEGLSEQQATFKASEDDWSVRELLRHAVQAKRGVVRTCQSLAQGEAREGSAEPGRVTGELPTLAEAGAELDAAQDDMLAFLDGISTETNTEATFGHPFFGPLNSREWAAFQRVHDGDHAQQIEQIKASAGFPA